MAKFPYKVSLDHVMVDVETLGTGERAVVASVGAVYFTPTTIDEGGGFYEALKWQEQLDRDGTVTEGAIKFWLKQLDKVREPLLRGGGSTVSEVLLKLGRWFEALPGSSELCVWAKGPQFDLALLESLYRRWDIDPPWRYWQGRDVRTALMLDAAYNVARGADSDEHHAFDDAVHQAKQVQRFLVGCGVESVARRNPGAVQGRGGDDAGADLLG
jgi:exodeoxyribonuclease VIII